MASSNSTKNVNFRMDAAMKEQIDEICQEMGINLTTALNIFVKKVIQERRIPFDITADPFYSAENMAHVRRGIAQLNAGHGKEHSLIEEDLHASNLGR